MLPCSIFSHGTREVYKRKLDWNSNQSSHANKQANISSQTVDTWNLQLLLASSPTLQNLILSWHNRSYTLPRYYDQAYDLIHSAKKSGGFLLITSQFPMSPHPRVYMSLSPHVPKSHGHVPVPLLVVTVKVYPRGIFKQAYEWQNFNQ